MSTGNSSGLFFNGDRYKIPLQIYERLKRENEAKWHRGCVKGIWTAPCFCPECCYERMLERESRLPKIDDSNPAAS